MKLVLVYDVVDDRRRTRLFRRLQRWLTPVQYSVFEGDGGPREHHGIVDAVVDELDLGQDDVRVYRLCARCASRVEHIGQAVPVPDPDTPIVV